MGIQFKQIVYNLEDYGGSGGLVSTKQGDLSELVYSAVYQNNLNDSTETTTNDETDYENKKIDIFGVNILKGFNNVKKIGIQAPPGTKFTFNKATTQDTGEWIMIGRTGIYELNDDIVINYLRFQRPQNYIVNKELSQQLQATGTGIMKVARDIFLQKINELEKTLGQAPDRTEAGSEYWTEYNNAHQNYITQYKSGLGIYLKGKAGVYAPDPTIVDLYNIIIDFTYETYEGGDK